jgi:hypothetical protein
MSSSIHQDTYTILRALAQLPRSEGQEPSSSGPELTGSTGLPANQINDAVTVLVDSGLAEWLKTLGTGPYNFRDVWITPRGRYEFQRTLQAEPHEAEGVRAFQPPSPAGSPYGFTDQDWETVAERKDDDSTLYVVLGSQFDSKYYDTAALRTNVEAMFRSAVDAYNQLPATEPITLDFNALSAGYGEHLFNEIARDIISADVAVFETSDLNPNVMIEMGVALTWGVRVLPIKRHDTPKPPSDISGQTWADYLESGGAFQAPDHQRKLVRMIERAVQKKGSS